MGNGTRIQLDGSMPHHRSLNRKSFMTHEQLRDEWNGSYPNLSVISNREATKIADYWLSRIDAYADARLREAADKLEKGISFRKKYDGNSIKSASDFHGIGAEDWSEIIRYEEGIKKGLSDAASLVRGMAKGEEKA